MPTVSVVVPSYNHARFLRQRLDTILAQTYQDFELIVLDDCSTDDSRTILTEYADDSRVRLEFNQINSGSPFRQWNKGVRLARGKYVWIAESDDFAGTRFLERLVPILDSGPRIQLAYCRSWLVSESGGQEGLLSTYIPGIDRARWSGDFRTDGREECRRCMIYGCTVQNASAALFRKSAYEHVGGADETFRICGDWKFWCSLMLIGEIAYIAEPLNYFRSHGGTARIRFGLWREGVTEWLTVVRWILDRVTVPQDVLNGVYAYHADIWVRAVLSRTVSLKAKAEIFRRAKAIDPHPTRSAALLIPRRIGLTISKIWYQILDFTYEARHAAGLTREGLAQARAKFGR